VQLPNPWNTSLDLLDRTRPRFVIGGGGLAVRWEPVGVPNPRRRDGRPFQSTPEAVRFVVDRLRGIERDVLQPRVRARLEPFRQDRTRVALVMEIGGPHGHRPVYVKWIVDAAADDDAMVAFISFHESDRIRP